jgi:hypothetical protein
VLPFVVPPLIFDRRTCLPRIVTVDWVDQSWNEKTLLDEESKWLLLSQDVFLTGILQDFWLLESNMTYGIT